MNAITPRLFIAATEQNAGKTTTSLGLHAGLREHFPKIGYIKPVGQRFVDIDGHRIDEDSLLIRETFGTEVPIEDMSPIAVEPQFTRRYINHANSDALVRRIVHSFDRSAWEKDFAIIEGTGHAGVGSVFDLSNARVARVLQSKVLLVTGAGIGRPIDEAALNKALFDQEGVEVIGVVMNKVLPDRMESIADIARRGFERLGLELLGMIPRERMLSQPTLAQISEKINAQFLHGEDQTRRRIHKAIIGAESSANLLADPEPDSLLIIPGDRDETIMAVLERSQEPSGGPFCAMVLSDGLPLGAELLKMIKRSRLPVMNSCQDSYVIANRIHSMTVKTLPGTEKKSSVSKDWFVPRLISQGFLKKFFDLLQYPDLQTPMNSLRTPLFCLLVVLGSLSPGRGQEPEPAARVQVIFQNLMNAVQVGDHAAMVLNGDNAFKSGLTPKMAAAVHAQLGARMREGYTATFLTAMRQASYEVYLWKVSFKDAADDVLVKVVLNKDGQVAGFFIS